MSKSPIEHAKEINDIYIDWAENSTGVLAENTEYIAKDVIVFMLDKCKTCKKTKRWRQSEQ